MPAAQLSSRDDAAALRGGLRPLLEPRSLAIVGASDRQGAQWALVERTSRVRVSLNTAILPTLHPFFWAQYLASLDVQSDGRTIAGAAIGWWPDDFKVGGGSLRERGRRMDEALGMPYTQAAALRGLPRRTVIWDHAMRNAGVPLVNAVAINIVYLLSGVIVVEWVFAFPGIGQGLVQATSTSDAFNVEAIALLMGAMFIFVSLAADFLVAYLNPRLKAAAAR